MTFMGCLYGSGPTIIQLNGWVRVGGAGDAETKRSAPLLTMVRLKDVASGTPRIVANMRVPSSIGVVTATVVEGDPATMAEIPVSRITKGNTVDPSVQDAVLPGGFPVPGAAGAVRKKDITVLL